MYIYTMEFHSPVKKNNMKYLGKWAELENTLSEVTRAQKDKHHRFSLICKPWPLIFICVYICRNVGVESKKQERGHEVGIRR